MTGVNIRKAVAQDAAGCAAIYAPFVTDSTASFEATPPDAEEMARRISCYKDQHGWLVAERNGMVVGYAYAHAYRERAAYRFTAETSIYLHPDAGGKGIGRALYGALLDRLAEAGLHSALAIITLPNPRSIAFHEAMGFVACGRLREVGHKHGGWHDTGWWQKML